MRQFRARLIAQFERLLSIPEYFPALAKEWLNILFGETLLGIAFLIWWALGAPTNHALIVTFVIAMFLAGYYAWRADHVRLQRRIKIAGVFMHDWSVPQDKRGTGFSARAWFFTVVNESDAVTIEDVNVQLRAISPEVPTLNWLPIHLHLKHDNPAKAEDYRQSFSLHPGEPRSVDFVSALEGDNRFTVEHTVPAVNKSVPFDTEGHRLQVMVTAKDMPVLLVWFKVWRDEAGLIQCAMEN
jgi:hypothetical protein